MLTARAKQIGDRLAEMRKHRKLTQQKLATRSCISLAMLRKYEQGRASVRNDVLIRLAAVLRCQPRQLNAPPGSPLPHRCKPDQLLTITALFYKLGISDSQQKNASQAT